MAGGFSIIFFLGLVEGRFVGISSIRLFGVFVSRGRVFF